MLVPIPLVADAVEVLGRVNAVQIERVYSSVILSADRTVYRLDRAGASLNIVDDSTPATSGSSNAWAPFGSNPIPANAALRVFDSTDGVWATHELALSQGGIASFRSVGWHRIDFGSTADRQAWRPTHDPGSAVPSRKYLRFELDDAADKDSFIVACGTSDIIAALINVTTAGSPTQAPRLAEIVLVRRGQDHKWVDDTANHSGAVETPWTPQQATWIPVPGAETIFGFSDPAYQLDEYLFRRDGAGSTWRVYASGAGSSWIEVTDYISGSDFHQSGPATLAASADHFVSTWTPPAGWAKRSLGALSGEGGGTLATPSLYWLRFVLNTSAQEPQSTSSYRTRARQFGTASTSGYGAPSARSFVGCVVYLRGNKSGTGDRTVRLVNLSTGAMRNVLIPTGSVQGDFVPATFATPLAVAAGETFGVLVGDGGASYSDALLYLETAA